MLNIEIDAKSLFVIFAVIVGCIGIVTFFIILINGKKQGKKQENIPNKMTPKSRIHSDKYLYYYNNIHKMSFEQIDAMRDVLFEYSCAVSSTVNMPLFLEAYDGIDAEEAARRNAENLRKKRNQKIPDKPYGCETYGEAYDMLLKVRQDKEYWEYANSK